MICLPGLRKAFSVRTDFEPGGRPAYSGRPSLEAAEPIVGVILFELQRDSALAFSIPMKSGQVLATVGDAIDFGGRVPQETTCSPLRPEPPISRRR